MFSHNVCCELLDVHLTQVNSLIKHTVSEKQATPKNKWAMLWGVS